MARNTTHYNTLLVTLLIAATEALLKSEEDARMLRLIWCLFQKAFFASSYTGLYSNIIIID
jgi:hypothetical protein